MNLTADGGDRYKTLQLMDLTADVHNRYKALQLMDFTANGRNRYKTLHCSIWILPPMDETARKHYSKFSISIIYLLIFCNTEENSAEYYTD